MADFMNQAIMQQRRSGGDPQGAAIQQAAAGIRQQAAMNLQRQQAAEAQKNRELEQGLTALNQDWIPTEDKVRIANKIGGMFGIQGQITAEGINPYRSLLTDMQKDLADGKDMSRWAQTAEIFVANPKYVDPSQRQSVIEAQQQIKEQQVQQVASQMVPSVEGGPEAKSRTQEARGRLAMFNSIKPDDPEAGQRLEAFTKVYGSADALQRQIEADSLVVQDEDLRTQDRERYAAALRMAPAELAKQSAALVDPKTMLLPAISKAIQEKGVEGLNDKERRLVEAHYTMNGQPEKLAVFSEGARVNELKRYQQDLTELRGQVGTIDTVQKVMAQGTERIGAYEAATMETLDTLEKQGTKLPAEAYAKRQEALGQLATATHAVTQDWEATMQPVRDELTQGANQAKGLAAELTKQLSRPGVDRVMLTKRRDLYQQQADLYEQMNGMLGSSSALDLALKKGEVRSLEIEAKQGENEEARASAANLIPERRRQLDELQRKADQQTQQMASAKERLSRLVKWSEMKVSAADKKLEQSQQNGVVASAFLTEWAQSGFKLNPDAWFTTNGKFFDGADPKLFMDTIKPAMESRKDIQQGLAERELLATGDMKQAGTIAAKYGVKPSDILGVLKDPNRPVAEVKIGEGLAKEVGPMMQESRAQALGALDTVDAVERARTAIEKGQVTVGPTATIRNKIAQFSQLLGVGGKDIEEQLINTRNLMRSMAQFTVGARKALKGQGQVSDYEGKLLAKAESGEIDEMTLPEIKSFLSVTDRLARKQYAQHQHNMGVMRQNPNLKEIAPFYDVPGMPEARKAAPTVPTIKSDDEFNALPSGSVFIGPDGKKRKKP